MIYHPENHGYSDVGIGLETVDSVSVYNNTIYLNHNYPNAIEYRFSETNSGIIKNNLTNKSITSRSDGIADVSNNIYNAKSDWFTDFENGDLHLDFEVSSVVDAGVLITGLSDDFDQDFRPIGNGIDIGADEYESSSTGNFTILSESKIKVFPNPTIGEITIHSPTKALVKIYNSKGALVEKISLLKGENRFDMSNSISGIYLLNSNLGNTIRLVKD